MFGIMHVVEVNPRNIEIDPILPSLTGQQLAAAQLVAGGLPTKALAGELGTTTRTVNRWKLGAEFRVEVRRVHELIAMQRAKGRPHERPTPRLFSGGVMVRGRSEPADLTRLSPRRAAANYPSTGSVDRPSIKSIEQDSLEVEAMIAELLGEKKAK